MIEGDEEKRCYTINRCFLANPSENLQEITNFCKLTHDAGCKMPLAASPACVSPVSSRSSIRKFDPHGVPRLEGQGDKYPLIAAIRIHDPDLTDTRMAVGAKNNRLTVW